MSNEFVAELIEEALDVAVDYGYATGYAAGLKAAEKDNPKTGPDPEQIEQFLDEAAEKLYNGVGIDNGEAKELIGRSLKALKKAKASWEEG